VTIPITLQITKGGLGALPQNPFLARGTQSYQ